MGSSTDWKALGEECYALYDGRETLQTYIDAQDLYARPPVDVYAHARASDAASMAMLSLPAHDREAAFPAIRAHVYDIALADIKAESQGRGWYREVAR